MSSPEGFSQKIGTLAQFVQDNLVSKLCGVAESGEKKNDEILSSGTECSELTSTADVIASRRLASVTQTPQAAVFVLHIRWLERDQTRSMST